MERSRRLFPQRQDSAGALVRVLLLIAGLAIMAACGGSSSGGGTTTTTSVGTATASLSITSLTFTSGVGVASATQSVTLSNTNTGTAGLTISGITTTNSVFTENNNCSSVVAAGSSCTITVTFTPTAAGTVTGSLTIADSASGSPQMVSLTGTASSASLSTTTLTFSGVAVGTTSAEQTVTLTNGSTTALTISSITVSTGFELPTACPSSIAAGGNCNINVTFTPTASGTVTGTLTIVDSAGTQTVSLTGSTSNSNQVPVSVNAGPAPSGGFLNFAYVTVTICQPGTTTCVQVPNVQIDTMSTGLRIEASALTGVNLAQLNDGSGNNLNECVEYGDGEFNYGPVAAATVQIGGETASQVPASAGGTANQGIPIQIISSDTVPKAVQAAGQCITTSSTPDQDTVAAFGANGILGIASPPQDCYFEGTNYCDNTTDAEALYENGQLFYWYCSAAGACQPEVVPITQQLWNPIATFSSTDTNGAQLTMLSPPAAGAATVTGTLTFGIATQGNNAIPSGATVYAQDIYGYFPEVTFNGVNYSDVNSGATAFANPSFLDTGSSVYFISDAATLTSVTGVSTTTCTTGTADGLYCPASTLNLSGTLAAPATGLVLYGANSSQPLGVANMSISNAQTLLTANPSFVAFDNFGSPSGTDPSNDEFDLGMPFFYGKTITIGIAGTNSTYPNGYWAF